MLGESQKFGAEPRMKIKIRRAVPASLLMLELEAVRCPIGAQSVLRAGRRILFCAGWLRNDLTAAVPVIYDLELQDRRVSQFYGVGDLAAMHRQDFGALIVS